MSPQERWVVEILRKVERTIGEHGLFTPEESVLIAVSGGPDSVALLHMLVELAGTWRWQLNVAHVQHGLRGEEAEEDLRFVRQMATGLGLPFFFQRIPPGRLKELSGSLQEVARRERYRILESLRVRCPATKIALGHQADDQSETVLAAMLRGAGLRGLGGMPYDRGDSLVRPLLDLNREEIVRYLETRCVPYRRDPSNNQVVYRRNRIRHELLPLLRDRFNPRIDKRLREMARICRAEDAYLKNLTRALWEEMVISDKDHVGLPIHSYRAQPKALRYRLLREAYEHLSEERRKLDVVHVDALDHLTKKSGEEKWLHLPGSIHAVVGGDCLVLGRAESLAPGALHYRVSCPGETLVEEAKILIRWESLKAHPPDGWRDEKDAVYMDLDGFHGDLILRGPHPGDRLRPIGLGGTRKVQDILVDRRVPRRARWRIPMLVDEIGVGWVIGHCMDERVMIRAVTQRVLKATVRSHGRLSNCW